MSTRLGAELTQNKEAGTSSETPMCARGQARQPFNTAFPGHKREVGLEV